MVNKSLILKNYDSSNNGVQRNRYFPWQDIVCSFTLVPMLIFALLLKIHFIAEQNSIARQLQLSKDSLPTAPMSSPVSTTVGCSQLFIWK